jgi:hypothetical protein
MHVHTHTPAQVEGSEVSSEEAAAAAEEEEEEEEEEAEGSEGADEAAAGIEALGISVWLSECCVLDGGGVQQKSLLWGSRGRWITDETKAYAMRGKGALGSTGHQRVAE